MNRIELGKISLRSLLPFALAASAAYGQGTSQQQAVVVREVREYAEADGLPSSQIAAVSEQPRVGQPDDVIVDPLTGESQVRGEAPRPAPVKTTVDERGVTHYPVENDDTRRAALLETLYGRISYDGAQPPARYALERVMAAMFAQTPVDILQRLANSRLSIRIVPRGSTIPEMPGTGYLAGKTTPDGRTMEEVRGLATSEGEVYMRKSVLLIPDGNAPAREVVFDQPVAVPVGAWTVFVPEANLEEPIGAAKGRDGLPRETVVHELGHAVHKVGTADDFDERWGSDREIVIEREFNDAREQKLGYTDPYAKTNSGEFFAQATVSWFGLNSDGKGADWIRENHPELYQTLLSIYGPPRSLGLQR